MVLIYVNKSVPRLQYIAALIFKDLLKIPYAITSHSESFKNFDGIKLNYTNDLVSEDELKIPNNGLLYQPGIRQQNVSVTEIEDVKIFFQSSTQNFNQYPFDIFSASFYLVSRYEEYLPHEKDKYRRYNYQNSIAFKAKFLNVPLINIWIDDFLKWLQKAKPDLESQPKQFKYIPTYDVDIAYSYLHKGVAKNVTGGLQSILKFNFKKVSERLSVLSGNRKDPFDTFDWLDQLHTKCELKPFYFFLVPEKNSQYDKNILPSADAMRLLIKTLSNKYSIGLHPSWQSGGNFSLLKKEKETLEKISDNEIKKTRQHYIRFDLPEGYRRLIKAELKDDYSMGYGASNGFRASIASAFFWYDLEKEEQTKLKIHPFCYMDSTAIFVEKLSAEESYKQMVYYFNACKNVNETFISILHNHLLADDKIEWKNIYERFILENFST